MSARLSVVLLGLVAFTGCQATQQARPSPKPVTAIVTLTSEQLDTVYQGVRDELKDPNSAIFGRVVAGTTPESDNILLVCGWVNAKNSYGGYTGEKPFMGSMIRGVRFFTLLSIGGTDSQTRVVLTLCTRQGLSL